MDAWVVDIPMPIPYLSALENAANRWKYLMHARKLSA